MTSNKLEECKAFLQKGRAEAVSYVRTTWLKFQFGETISQYLNYDRVSELGEDWKTQWLRTSESRHAMRKAYALGIIRWGLVILEAATKYGEDVAKTAEEALFSQSNSDLTEEELLPASQFGVSPLGGMSDDWLYAS